MYPPGQDSEVLVVWSAFGVHEHLLRGVSHQRPLDPHCSPLLPHGLLRVGVTVFSTSTHIDKQLVVKVATNRVYKTR